MFSRFLHDGLLILCLGLLHTVLWNQPCQRIYRICVTQAACLDLHLHTWEFPVGRWLHVRVKGTEEWSPAKKINMTCLQTNSLSLPHWHAIQIFFLPACIMNVSNILKAFKIHQNYAGTMAICSYVVQCGKLHARPVASSLSPWQRISSADCGTAPKPRSSLQWSHSLVLSSLVGFLSLCSRGQRTRKPQVWLASSRTKLLVDGDCHSIDGIRLAIRCLEEHCGETVHTTLFAPPKRLLSKKWRKFIEEDGMSFQPIHRASIDLSAEPNDQALAEAMRQLFKLQVSVALLTEDSDFIEPIVDLEEIGANITVLLPENLYGLIHRYKRHGVKVLEVPLPRKPPGTRVRALLHQDGGGSVKLADPYQTPASEHFASVQNEVANLLQALGYGDVRQGYLVNGSDVYQILVWKPIGRSYRFSALLSRYGSASCFDWMWSSWKLGRILRKAGIFSANHLTRWSAFKKEGKDIWLCQGTGCVPGGRAFHVRGFSKLGSPCLETAWVFGRRFQQCVWGHVFVH